MATSEVNLDLSTRPRREVDGRVEIWIKCPVGCHGFGVCSTCNDEGGWWDRPRPSRYFYSPFTRTRGCF